MSIEDGATRGLSFPASRKIFFAKLRQRFVKVAVISYSSDRCAPTFDVQTNRIDCCSGISRANEFFFLSLFFFLPSPHQFFRLQPSRAPLEDIEDNQETHNSADKAQHEIGETIFLFELEQSDSLFLYLSVCLSLSLSIYICMYMYIYARR